MCTKISECSERLSGKAGEKLSESSCRENKLPKTNTVVQTTVFVSETHMLCLEWFYVFRCSVINTFHSEVLVMWRINVVLRLDHGKALR